MIYFSRSSQMSWVSYCQNLLKIILAALSVFFFGHMVHASCATERAAIQHVFDVCASTAPGVCSVGPPALYENYVVASATLTNNIGQKYTSFTCYFTKCGSMELWGVWAGPATYSPSCSQNFLPTKVTAEIEKPFCQKQSIVQTHNRALGEEIPLIGASFSLMHFSQYAQGRDSLYALTLPVTGSSVDPHVTGYVVTVRDADNNVLDNASFGAATNQTYNFLWNGLDGSSSSTWGPIKVKVTVQENATDFSPSHTTEQIVGGLKALKLGVGGWLPSNWKFYSVAAETLYSADGASRKVTSVTDGSYLRVAEEDGSQVYYFNSAGKLVYIKLGITGATIATFFYDGNGYLSSIVEPFGRTTTFNRDFVGKLTSIVSPNGKTTTVTLDANGYLETVTTPAGGVYEMTYLNSGGLLTTFEKPNGASNSFSYDSNGDLSVDSHSGGSGLTLASISGGVSSTSSMGRVTKYTLDQQRAKRIVTYPDNSVYSRSVGTTSDDIVDRDYKFSHSSGSDPRFGTQVKALNTLSQGGIVQRRLYYTRNVSLTNPADPFSIATYVLEERLGSATSTDKYVSTYTGSTKTNVTVSPLGRSRTQQFDNYQRVISDQMGSLSAVSYTYTDDKLTHVSQGSRDTSLTYDVTSGLLDSVTNELGQTTSFTYDNNERLATQTLPDLRVVTYLYDSEGNLTSVTPPGRPAHLFTIGNKELVTVYSPPTLNSLLDYTTTYTYNNDRQLTQISRPTGQAISFTYNATTGLMTTMTAPAGNYTYTYTGGRLTQVQNPSGFSATSGYSTGQLSFVILKNSSSQVLLRVNKASSGVNGKISSETAQYKNGTSLVTNFTYDNDELLTGVGNLTLARGATNGEISGTTLGVVADTRTYNSFGELTNYVAEQSGVGDLYEEAITRDDLGRVAQKIVTFQGGTPVTYDYTYDVAGRLTEVKKDTVTDSTYSYSDNSNRTGGSIRGTATSTTYNDQDQITAFNAYTYTYNMNGDLATKTNTLTSEVWTYTYDVFGNLTSVVTPTKTITYEIDPLQRRMGKKVNGVLQVRYMYDVEGRLAAELNSSDAVIRRYIYATQSHSPDYYREGSTDYRIIKDHLGSPRLIVNATTGAIVQQMEHDEFGRVLTDTNPGATAIGFAGGLYDVDTKLVRFGARDYDPELGRFASKDPSLFFGGDINLYGYVMNDPVNLVDPQGHFALLVSGAVGGAFGATAGYVTAIYNNTDRLQDALIGGATGFAVGSGAALFGGAAAGAGVGLAGESLASAIGAAWAGFTGNVAAQVAVTGNLNLKEAGVTAATGAAGGACGQALGGGIPSDLTTGVVQFPIDLIGGANH